MQTCNGVFCKGKTWPENRFEKDKSCKSGRKSACKMCVANKHNKEFVPGICMFCSEKHECMFGAGTYCNRQCALGHTQKKISEAPIPQFKICGNKACQKSGEQQPISSFYVRAGERSSRSYCKKCTLMSVRKSQTTLDGSFKVSYNSASARARLYNREFSITVEDLKKQFEKQDGKCAITGKSLNHTIKQNGKAKSPFNMSLDRIDSSKGYTVDNIQWVCVWIQTAKSDWDEAEFKQWIVDAGKYIKQKAV